MESSGIIGEVLNHKPLRKSLLKIPVLKNCHEGKILKMLLNTLRKDWSKCLSGIATRLASCLHIGLVHDYVTCSKFTTKPHLGNICLNFCCSRVVFTWVFFSFWLLWELAYDKIYTLHYQSKADSPVLIATILAWKTSVKLPFEMNK